MAVPNLAFLGGNVMGQNPLLTIAVPVFNGAGDLALTLESLEGLDDPRVEILVSDNASNDSSVTEAESFLQGPLPFMKIYVQTTNLGLSGNCKFLASQAMGEFIWFLSAGETVSHQSLANILDIVSQNRNVNNFVLTGRIRANEAVSETLCTFRDKGKTPFSETIALNIIRTSFARNISKAEREDVWPHIEAILLGASNPFTTLFVSSGVLVEISENKQGWWYHSPFVWQIYCEKIKFISWFQQNNKSSIWASRDLNTLRKMQFLLMSYETRKHNVNFSSEDLRIARNSGIPISHLLVARVANFVPRIIFRFTSGLFGRLAKWRARL